MTVLMSAQQGGDLRRKKCDARCYDATHEKCDCICGGMNHGVGLHQAQANTEELAKKVKEIGIANLKETMSEEDLKKLQQLLGLQNG